MLLKATEALLLMDEADGQVLEHLYTGEKVKLPLHESGAPWYHIIELLKASLVALSTNLTTRELHCSAAHPLNGGYLSCGPTVQWCTAYLHEFAYRYKNLPEGLNIAVTNRDGQRQWMHYMRSTNQAALRREVLLWVRRVAEPHCCVLCLDE